MPEGKDPDDYIKQNGKEGLLNLLKKKEIIQSFVWNYSLSKLDQSNPYEISKFEKDIKKLSYSIKDDTLKKYVLEDFLEKIKNLTPIQTSRQNLNYFSFKKKKDFKILNETKILTQKRKNLSKNQIVEFSLLFIMLNHLKLCSRRIEEISDLELISEKNQSLKNSIIELLSVGNNEDELKEKIDINYQKLIEEIKENSNIQLIIKNKNENEILELIDELIIELKEQNNIKKIES